MTAEDGGGIVTQVRCVHCKEMIERRSAKRHKRKTCPYRIVECDECHAVRIPFCDLQAHKDNECESVSVTCPQCPQSCLRGDLADHLNDRCPMRKVSCPNVGLGCKWCGAYEELCTHLALCAFTTFVCSWCLEEMEQYRMPGHACPRARKEDKCVVCLEKFGILIQEGRPGAILLKGFREGVRRSCRHISMCLRCANDWRGNAADGTTCPICRSTYDGVAALPLHLLVGDLVENCAHGSIEAVADGTGATERPPLPPKERMTPCTQWFVSPLDIRFTHDRISEHFRPFTKDNVEMVRLSILDSAVELLHSDYVRGLDMIDVVWHEGNLFVAGTFNRRLCMYRLLAIFAPDRFGLIKVRIVEKHGRKVHFYDKLSTRCNGKWVQIGHVRSVGVARIDVHWPEAHQALGFGTQSPPTDALVGNNIQATAGASVACPSCVTEWEASVAAGLAEVEEGVDNMAIGGGNSIVATPFTSASSPRFRESSVSSSTGVFPNSGPGACPAVAPLVLDKWSAQICEDGPWIKMVFSSETHCFCPWCALCGKWADHGHIGSARHRGKRSACSHRPLLASTEQVDNATADSHTNPAPPASVVLPTAVPLRPLCSPNALQVGEDSAAPRAATGLEPLYIDLELSRVPGERWGIKFKEDKQHQNFVVKQSPATGAAAAYGNIMAGDRIISVNGCNTPTSMRIELLAYSATQIQIRIARFSISDGQTLGAESVLATALLPNKCEDQTSASTTASDQQGVWGQKMSGWEKLRDQSTGRDVFRHTVEEFFFVDECPENGWQRFSYTAYGQEVYWNEATLRWFSSVL